MIKTLYPIFQKWSEKGSVYILSDLHLDDYDCKYMDKNWVSPEKQIEIINSMAHKNDTFICLGDVGNPEYALQIKAGHKVLILGNHDKHEDFINIFDEIYSGALFIADRILLSHEPVTGLDWCLNIHGHDHNNSSYNYENCKHLNLAANVCGYTPISLGKIIKDGILSDIEDIHRKAINKQMKAKELKGLSIDPYDEIPVRKCSELGTINAEDCYNEYDEKSENERFVLTEWGCLSATLEDYGIDVSRVSGKVGGHIVEDFMDLMCKHGHVAKAGNKEG